ncbi:CdaR family protein [Brevibacillus dissolubilis]|uniref:CdaR family protein n=1 Tax=Brevibacillus dissolubilis TaxID=1844116 RepID=UPI001115FBDA|nr:CdaR family protein [Brevibacillus dissolubilis]
MDRWLNSHWFARSVALLLAIMLWMVVNFEPESGATTEVAQPTFIEGVKITPYYDSERFEVVKQLQTVRVAVESTNPFFRYNNFFTTDSYEFFVDAKGLGKGTHNVAVQYKGFPEGTVVNITPSVVPITLEEKQIVEKDVSIDPIGKVALGYKAGEAIVKPFRVHVKGPASQLKNIGLVKATVNLEGAKEEITDTVPLKVYDKTGSPMQRVEVYPPTVEVKVPVTSPYLLIPLKMNLTNDLPDGYSLASIVTSVEEATVYGPQDVIKSVTTYPGPDIDLSKIKSDLVLQLKMPLMPGVVKVEPEFIEVSLKVVPSETKRLENVPLRISGLADKLTARVLAADGQEVTTVNFDVIGAPQNLRGLTVEDVQVLVDVSSLPVGVHEVPVTYNPLPNYLKVAPTAVKQVTVEITNKP